MPPQQAYLPGQQPMYQQVRGLPLPSSGSWWSGLIWLNFTFRVQMAPPGGPQQQAQHQLPQAAPGSTEAQLISFD